MGCEDRFKEVDSKALDTGQWNNKVHDAAAGKGESCDDPGVELSCSEGGDRSTSNGLGQHLYKHLNLRGQEDESH